MGLDFEADKPRMNAELRVIKSNDGWTVTTFKLNQTQNNTTWHVHPCKPGRNFSCRRKSKLYKLTEALGWPGCSRDVFAYMKTPLVLYTFVEGIIFSKIATYGLTCNFF